MHLLLREEKIIVSLLYHQALLYFAETCPSYSGDIKHEEFTRQSVCEVAVYMTFNYKLAEIGSGNTAKCGPKWTTLQS